MAIVILQFDAEVSVVVDSAELCTSTPNSWEAHIFKLSYSYIFQGPEVPDQQQGPDAFPHL